MGRFSKENQKNFDNRLGKFFNNPPRKDRTICEVHREIYRMLKADGVKDDSLLVELLYEAYIMAKKMSQKLRQYKHNYDDNWWKKNNPRFGEFMDELKGENKKNVNSLRRKK
jgi:hypothetical protein